MASFWKSHLRSQKLIKFGYFKNSLYNTNFVQHFKRELKNQFSIFRQAKLITLLLKEETEANNLKKLSNFLDQSFMPRYILMEVCLLTTGRCNQMWLTFTQKKAS